MRPQLGVTRNLKSTLHTNANRGRHSSTPRCDRATSRSSFSFLHLGSFLFDLNHVTPLSQASSVTGRPQRTPLRMISFCWRRPSSSAKADCLAFARQPLSVGSDALAGAPARANSSRRPGGQAPPQPKARGCGARMHALLLPCFSKVEAALPAGRRWRPRETSVTIALEGGERKSKKK